MKIIKTIVVQLLQLFKYSQSVLSITMLSFLGVLIVMSIVYVFGDQSIAFANYLIQVFRIPDGNYSWEAIGADWMLKVYAAVSLVVYIFVTIIKKVFNIHWVFTLKKKLLLLIVYTTAGYALVYAVFFKTSAGAFPVIVLFWFATVAVSMYAAVVSWIVKKICFVIGEEYYIE